MHRGSAVAFSVGAVAAAAIIGGSYGPQNPRAGLWYARLRKPPYTPPGPAIGGIWGVLEALLCVAGARLLTRPRGEARTIALLSWGATLAGLAGYPAAFFGARRLGGSAAIATGMWAAATTTAVAAAKVDRAASAAMLPLGVWTGFAVLLSEELWRRN